MESFREIAYLYKIKPLEFSEMTCKEIGEYCVVQMEKEEENLKYLSSILYRISDKYVLETHSQKPKKLSFNEVFPEFKEKQPILSEEQKNILIAEKWREFLK